jgi:hypothetical protein
MKAIDHTEARWAAAHRGIDRENGAHTYGKELVRHHLPVWEEYYGEEDILISFVPLLDEITIDRRYSHYVQYLHTYDSNNPYKITEGPMRAVIRQRQYKEHITFITAYKSLERALVAKGFRCLYIPMSLYRPPKQRVAPKHYKRLIYFGNANRKKGVLLLKIAEEARKAGYGIDYMSDGRFNGWRMGQQRAWELISCYEYGIGVGRCALEMMHLGLRVIIAGEKFGGVIADKRDLSAKEEVNYSGANVTFSSNIAKCIGALPTLPLIKPETINVRSYIHGRILPRK